MSKGCSDAREELVQAARPGDSVMVMETEGQKAARPGGSEALRREENNRQAANPLRAVSGDEKRNHVTISAMLVSVARWRA